MKKTLCILVLYCVSSPSFAEEPFPQFKHRTIEPDIGKVCYAVTLADVDGDEKRDIVAVSESKVFWYQNPTWERHLIIDSQTPLDNVCIAPHDIDGDGKIDFALGAGWTKIGTIHWLKRKESLDEPWEVHQIGVERWTHRMRWADVLGTGEKQLVVSPLNATVGEGVRLTAFQIPQDPAVDRWQSIVLNGELNRMHNHWHADLDGDRTVDTLTASREGIHLIEKEQDQWKATKLGSGAVADAPNDNGAGEIKSGQLRADQRFIAAVEPMHGHTLSVYMPPESEGEQLWQRQVVDSGFKRGHALWLSDVDRDGEDEIVFGHSDTPETFGVIIYDHTQAGWKKHVIDSGEMACEDLIVEDLNGDGWPEIVAGGRATHNVKLYLNQGNH